MSSDAYHVHHDPETQQAFGFSEKTIRLGFIRKVYGILSVQLAITLGFVALFLFQVVMFVSIIALACCEGLRRKSPWNVMILGLFTLCMSWMVGSTASHFEAREVMIAVGITAAITLALTLFAFQTKWDFTTMGGFLLVFLVGVLIFGLLAAIIRSNYLNMMYAAIAAILFGFYLVFDTQMMMGGNHKYAISPEEYVFGALNLYMDIINIFLNILSLIGMSRNN